MPQAKSSIFREYDIRGIYPSDIDEQVVRSIGAAVARYVSGKPLLIAMDFRTSSPSLHAAFVAGALSAGVSLIDAGAVPIGTAFLSAHNNGAELAFITASHLTKEWNGIKLYHVNGLGFSSAEIQQIRRLCEEAEKSEEVRPPSNPIKHLSSEDVLESYINTLLRSVKPKRTTKVVLDCGNGTTSWVAPLLFKKAGFDVFSIFAEPDGSFPNRNPDPLTDQLEALRAAVVSRKADIGIAYDGDGDRTIFVDNLGRKMTPEQAAWFMLSMLLKERSGPVVANIECSRVIDKIAERFERQVIRVPVGHTYMGEGVHKHGAVFGVESSSHYSLPHLMPFEDALAISYWAACALSTIQRSLSEIVDEVPQYPFARTNFACPDDRKFGVVESLKTKLASKYSHINPMDGIRIDLPEGWVLIRPSNTEPKIRLTIEAENQQAFESLKAEFSQILEKEIANAS